MTNFLPGYKTESGGGCVWGMDVGGGGYGWSVWRCMCGSVMSSGTVEL